VHQAIESANKIAYVASLNGDPIPASELSNKHVIRLRQGADKTRGDERRTPPIYNYARCQFIICHHVAGVELGTVFTWTLAVEHVYHAFREASEESHNYPPMTKTLSEKNHFNHRDSLTQATNRPKLTPAEVFSPPWGRWGSGLVSRFSLAAFVALCLTWGTTG
jgi:hypothetical protein